MSNKVLVGANVEVFVKGRMLRAVWYMTFKATAKGVCTATVMYYETDESGKFVTVKIGDKILKRRNFFAAFVTKVETVGGKTRFNVMPKSFVSDEQNDFTVEDEKFLLGKILESCYPAPAEPPVETL